MRETIQSRDHRWTARLSLAGRPRYVRALASILAHSGDSWFWLAGLGLLWWLGDPEQRWYAAVLTIGVLVTAAIVMIIKLLVRRKRPAGEWGSLYRRTDPHSFPSGHAARSAMLAVLGAAFGPPWLGVLLAAWAGLVSLARVALGVHYLSDIAAGIVAGVLVGLAIVQFI